MDLRNVTKKVPKIGPQNGPSKCTYKMYLKFDLKMYHDLYPRPAYQCTWMLANCPRLTCSHVQTYEIKKHINKYKFNIYNAYSMLLDMMVSTDACTFT
jgi:hypothetical protein